jgi:hypothetical protein
MAAQTKIFYSSLTESFFEQCIPVKEQKKAKEVMNKHCNGIFATVHFKEGQFIITKYPTVNMVDATVSAYSAAQFLLDLNE